MVISETAPQPPSPTVLTLNLSFIYELFANEINNTHTHKKTENRQSAAEGSTQCKKHC